MFANFGGDTNQCPAISRIPDGVDEGASWGHPIEVHGNWQEEIKSKEQETSAKEHTHPKSLASLRKESRVIACEAHPKGEPQYLTPYLIGESDTGKQIFNTDTYQEPDCLRFCPSNSSENVEISLSGFTVRAKSANQVARVNKSFFEGVHYWEIICPISLSTLQIGVSNKSSKEELTQQFRTTTQRVVGVELNLEKGILNFWLNGRFIKERNKKVPPGHQWYPTIKFKEADYFVVINPFAQARNFTVEESSTNYLSTALHTNMPSLFARFSASTMKGMLLVHGLTFESTKAKSTDEVETDLKNLLRL